MDRLVEICQRLMQQLSRTPLPGNVREQLSDAISSLLANTITVRDEGTPHSIEHVAKAASYLDGLARQLIKSGLGTSADRSGIARALIDSSRRLHNEIGGRYTKG
ncbi:hypothetical protein ACWEVP_45230 [Amycolatopsis sp. NPDC003865]